MANSSPPLTLILTPGLMINTNPIDNYKLITSYGGTLLLAGSQASAFPPE